MRAFLFVGYGLVRFFAFDLLLEELAGCYNMFVVGYRYLVFLLMIFY